MRDEPSKTVGKGAESSSWKPIEAIEKIMANPVVEPNEELSKIRMRLLVVGSISFVIGAFDLKIGKSANVVGLTIENLGDTQVRLILIGITIYLLVHFLWGSCDAFTEWKLRRSALAKHKGSTDDPKQLTIYRYWLDVLGDKAAVLNHVDKFRQSAAQLQQIVGDMGELSRQDTVRLEAVRSALKEASVALQGYESNKEKTNAQIFSPNDTVSYAVQRFDATFIGFQRSQNYRWFLFEFLLPLGLGLAAVFWLALRLLCSAQLAPAILSP